MTGFLAELFALDGRVAVVTGGSSGIGEAMASALALAGAQVVIVARDPTRLSATAKSLREAGCKVAWVSADLSDRAEVRRGASAAAAAFGEPDILVNCAGVNLRPPLESLSEEHWDLMMAVNLNAPFLLGQRFGPAMADRGWGRVINVTSQQAQRAFGNSGGYGASKGGLAALTRSQSEAWAAEGVCVNSVCPGFVPTPLNAEVAADPVRSAALAARTHIGRNGEPSDFAGVAVFLASTASDYVTGQTIYVDGGFSAVLWPEPWSDASNQSQEPKIKPIPRAGFSAERENALIMTAFGLRVRPPSSASRGQPFPVERLVDVIRCDCWVGELGRRLGAARPGMVDR